MGCEQMNTKAMLPITVYIKRCFQTFGYSHSVCYNIRPKRTLKMSGGRVVWLHNCCIARQRARMPQAWNSIPVSFLSVNPNLNVAPFKLLMWFFGAVLWKWKGKIASCIEIEVSLWFLRRCFSDMALLRPTEVARLYKLLFDYVRRSLQCQASCQLLRAQREMYHSIFLYSQGMDVHKKNQMTYDVQSNLDMFISHSC